MTAADPLPLLALVVTGGAYARGVSRLRARGNGLVQRRHLTAWLLACGALVAAFSGPVEARWATSFSAHMLQHLLLTLVAAPLLVLSTPSLPLLQGLPLSLRRPAARAHARARRLRSWTHSGGWPFAVVGLYAATGWLWHLPGPYQAALRNGFVHGLEHATMLGTGVLLWWTVLESGRRSTFGYGTGIATVFLAALQHAALGGVLTLAPAVLYPAYGPGPQALADQQLAGTLMWAPGKVVHGAVIVLLVVAWLRDTDARARRRESQVPDAA